MKKFYSWFKYKKILLLFGLIVIFFIISGVFTIKYFKSKSFPKIIIWAWERPENLLFLNDEKIEVAFFAGSIIFSNSEVNIKPRLQPLSVKPGTPMIPVIRIDNLNENTQLNNGQISKALEFIIKTCSQDKISGCQIDFDAKNSEINLYQNLIIRVKSEIPKSVPLSITALVSWCDNNSWLDSLPIEEAVPMFFRLGLDEYLIKSDSVGESFMKAKNCQKSVGISVDEDLPRAKYLKNRTIYIFNPEPWTTDSFFNIIKIIKAKISENK
jgi:hypothetical protein